MQVIFGRLKALTSEKLSMTNHQNNEKNYFHQPVERNQHIWTEMETSEFLQTFQIGQKLYQKSSSLRWIISCGLLTVLVLGIYFRAKILNFIIFFKVRRSKIDVLVVLENLTSLLLMGQILMMVFAFGSSEPVGDFAGNYLNLNVWFESKVLNLFFFKVMIFAI